MKNMEQQNPRAELLQGLGDHVRSLRQERELSRADLATSSGLSVRFLADLEAGSLRTTWAGVRSSETTWRSSEWEAITSVCLLANMQSNSPILSVVTWTTLPRLVRAQRVHRLLCLADPHSRRAPLC